MHAATEEMMHGLTWTATTPGELFAPRAAKKEELTLYVITTWSASFTAGRTASLQLCGSVVL